MPLIEADATGLEVVGAGFLSQCPVLCDEIRRDVDIHGNNQQRFKFPQGDEGRLLAKKFKFRLIYGGSEFSYAKDPDFNGISRYPKYWKGIIDEYYSKYHGMARWHTDLVRSVNKNNGRYTSPTGRTFQFELQKKYGVIEYPRTQILNYPVQSLGADIMSIIRISSFKRMRRELPEVLFVNTVHDSVLVDSPPRYTAQVIDIFNNVFSDFPRNFQRVYGSEFNLPLKCKIKVGDNWRDMNEYKSS